MKKLAIFILMVGLLLIPAVAFTAPSTTDAALTVKVVEPAAVIVEATETPEETVTVGAPTVIEPVQVIESVEVEPPTTDARIDALESRVAELERIVNTLYTSTYSDN